MTNPSINMQNTPKQKAEVWVTKYALTKGISKETAVIENDIAVIKYPGWLSKLYFKNDWHLSFGAAVNRAEIMRDAKIKSLKKQISNLEKLTFDTDFVP